MLPAKLLEEIQNLIFEGRSYNEIGTYLGKTKCAVAGIIYRYFRHVDRNKIIRSAYLKPIAEKPKPVVEEKKPTTEAVIKKAKKQIETFERSIRYPDPRFMTDGLCRAVIGKPRDLICCGNKVKEGKVYCEKHWREYCVVPTPPKKVFPT